MFKFDLAAYMNDILNKKLDWKKELVTFSEELDLHGLQKSSASILEIVKNALEDDEVTFIIEKNIKEIFEEFVNLIITEWDIVEELGDAFGGSGVFHPGIMLNRFLSEKSSILKDLFLKFALKINLYILNRGVEPTKHLILLRLKNFYKQVLNANKGVLFAELIKAIRNENPSIFIDSFVEKSSLVLDSIIVEPQVETPGQAEFLELLQQGERLYKAGKAVNTIAVSTLVFSKASKLKEKIDIVDMSLLSEEDKVLLKKYSLYLEVIEGFAKAVAADQTAGPYMTVKKFARYLQQAALDMKEGKDSFSERQVSTGDVVTALGESKDKARKYLENFFVHVSGIINKFPLTPRI